MGFEHFGSIGSALFAHLQTYGLLLVLVPLFSLAAIKVFLTLRTRSGRKPPTEWAFTGEYDENGLPKLTRASAVPPDARMRPALHTSRSQRPR